MKRAIITGSFDPMHLGHLDIIRRASALFDEVTVAVTVNLSKQSVFSFEDRVTIIKRATADLNNIKVDKITGLRADYVNAGGFDAEVRSLRNGTDFDYELGIAQMHSRLYNKTETLFLMTDPEYSFISSTQVREVGRLGGDISFMVDEANREFIERKLRG